MNNQERRCIDCGGPLPYSRTRPSLRCGGCKSGRRRITQRADVTCSDCGVIFTPPAQTGLPPKRCRDCAAKYRKEQSAQRQAAWRAANPERAATHSRKHHEKRKDNPAWRQYKRDAELRRSYGITRDQLNAMLEAQDHRCAICGGERNGAGTRLHIDHCHTTGRIRGLLCGKCNSAVGLLDDDPERAERLAAYLRQ